MPVTNYPRQDWYESTLAQDISASDLSMIAQDAVLFSLSSGTFSLFIDYDKPSKRERVIVTALDATKKIFTITRAANIAEGVSGTAYAHTAGAKILIAPGYADFKTLVDEKADKDAPTISDLTVTGFIDLPTYADATARDAAIPSPEEGYVVVLLDDGDGNRAFSVYDGSDWGFIAAPLQDVTIEGFLTVNGPLTVSSDYVRVPVYADDTARNAAIGAPALGMIIWNSTADTMQIYTSGGWDDLDLGTVTPLATTSVPGKSRLATVAQAIARTDTVSSDPVVLQPSHLDYATVLNMICEEDIAANDIVGISNLMATEANLRVAKGGKYQILEALPDSPDLVASVVPLDSTRIFVLYRDTSGNLRGVIGTYDIDVKTITYGTSVVYTASVITWSNKLGEATLIDTDKVVVAYRLDASNTVARYHVSTISGTTITVGTVQSLTTLSSAINCVSVETIDTNLGVFYIGGTTTSHSELIAFTISGTTLTPGTAVNPNFSTSQLSKLTDTSFILVRTTGESSIAGTLSGTSITLGSAETVSLSGNLIQNARVCRLADNLIVVGVYDIGGSSGNFTGVYAISASGSTLTAGAVADLGTPTYRSLVRISDTECYAISTDATSYISVSGNTATGEKSSYNHQFENNSPYASGKGLPYMGTNFISLDIDGLAYLGGSTNIIGVALASGSRGDTIAVKLRTPWASGQSGLYAGAFYNFGVDGSANLFDATNANTSDEKEEQMKQIMALSESRFLLT